MLSIIVSRVSINILQYTWLKQESLEQLVFFDLEKLSFYHKRSFIYTNIKPIVQKRCFIYSLQAN